MTVCTPLPTSEIVCILGQPEIRTTLDRSSSGQCRPFGRGILTAFILLFATVPISSAGELVVPVLPTPPGSTKIQLNSSDGAEIAREAQAVDAILIGAFTRDIGHRPATFQAFFQRRLIRKDFTEDLFKDYKTALRKSLQADIQKAAKQFPDEIRKAENNLSDGADERLRKVTKVDSSSDIFFEDTTRIAFCSSDTLYSTDSIGNPISVTSIGVSVIFLVQKRLISITVRSPQIDEQSAVKCSQDAMTWADAIILANP